MSAPDNIHEMKRENLIIITGRSNVGKSSIIRRLTRARVPVGKRPGTTKKMYFIEMGSVNLVDLPGFGHMQGQSKKRIERTKTEIIRTIESWKEKVIVAVLVVDISIFGQLINRWENRGEIPIDVEFYSFLCELFQNVVVVANKSDRLSRAVRHDVCDVLKTKMSEAVPTRELLVVQTDATSGQGIIELKHTIEQLLAKEKIPLPDW